MATIGQALTAPESGWKRFNDTDSNIVYVNLTSKSEAGNYNNNVKVFNGDDSTVKFNFTGKRIRIYTRTNSNFNMVYNINIDGVMETYTSKQSISSQQTLVYEKELSKNREHYVEITVKNFDSSFETARYFDCIDIDETGVLKSFNKNIFFNKILLLQNNTSYNIQEGEISSNLIPKMTSNTAPSGRAFASKIASTTFDAWKAFDSLYTTVNGGWSPNESNAWLGYEFPSAQIVNVYSMLFSVSDNLIDAPKNWTFEGSDDNSTWTVLDTRVNISWVVNVKQDFYFNNSKPYKLYRININNGSNKIRLAELEMRRLFAPKLNQLPSHSEENLIKYGVDSPVKVDGIFSSKNYILQDTVSENAQGLWTTQLNRKPLSIKFN